MNKQTIKNMTRGAYDLQKLRIQMGNRIASNFKVKLGIAPGEKEEASSGEAKKILSILKLAYNRITDGIETVSKRHNFEYDGVISTYSELCLVDQYMQLLDSEKSHFNKLKGMLDEFPIWTEWLKDVKGVGPAMGAVIISEIDIEEAKYVSSIWKYCGLDVADDGRGRSRRKEHLEEKEYVDKDGNTKTKMGITFNPFIKTKLVGVLGPGFLKAKGHYADVYYDYKNRLENMPTHKDKTKGHIHNMANRYAVKIFLQDLYNEWKQIEGLPVHPPYSEAKLGLEHSS